MLYHSSKVMMVLLFSRQSQQISLVAQMMEASALFHPLSQVLYAGVCKRRRRTTNSNKQQMGAPSGRMRGRQKHKGGVLVRQFRVFGGCFARVTLRRNSPKIR